MPSVGSRGKRRLSSDINVVPYIDVMLVLLVIFMVTAPMIPSGVVDLPTAGRTAATPEAYAELVVRKGGRFELQTHRTKDDTDLKLARDELAGAVRTLHAAEPQLPFVISGEKDVPYDDVISAMAVLQKQGVARIALMVRPDEAR